MELLPFVKFESDKAAEYCTSPDGKEAAPVSHPAPRLDVKSGLVASRNGGGRVRSAAEV